MYINGFLMCSTGIAAIDDIIPMFLANPAFIAGFVACFLDNTIPGTYFMLF